MSAAWTTREIAIVREHYPRGGVEACLPHMNRTRGAIYQHANALGLRAPGETGVREKQVNDQHLDERIRRLHERPLLRGAVSEFAKSVGRPTWYVSRRARELGLKTPRFREEPWTEAEIDLLHETAHIGTANARLRFLKLGFKRSETAIAVKRKRLAISTRDARLGEGLMSATQVAEYLGVNGKTPTGWIKWGELKASRRGTDRVAVQGGDEWVIRESDLRNFIIEYPMRV